MMFLSKLTLNRINRQVMRLLGDVYSLHKTVMSGFEAYQEHTRVLFRVEPEEKDGLVHILVQSKVEPSWALPGMVTSQVKEVHPVFHQGIKLRFRLRANPTVTRNGKRYGLIRDQSLEEWLRKKGKYLGVQFHSMSIVDEGYVTGARGREGHRLNLKTSLYEGLLTVTDAHLLEKNLTQGIGPGKAFGCGLLSLARG
jgi:CRISPR system Cascade subunit CasE